MQSTFCVNCKQPLPAGASFCSNCGARQAPASADAATQRTPPAPPIHNAPASDPNAPTQFVPPPAPRGDNMPTAMVPPPPPEATQRANTQLDHDPYASQYQGALPPQGAAPQPFSQYAGPGPSGPYPNQPAPFAAPPPPPPGYAPGPPPVMTPGGPAPWAQPPQKKKRGRGWLFGCAVAIVLVIAVIVGSVFAFNQLTKKNGSNNTGQHTGTSTNTSSTPTPTPTPGVGQGAQALNNLNLQAIYAGVTITIMSAQQASTVPGYQPNDPSTDALRIQVRLDNSTDTHDVYISNNTNVVGPNGTPYGTINPGTADNFPTAIPAQANILGYWYFNVPRGTKIGDWKLVIGAANESLVTVPLNGANYNPAAWQWVTKPITTKNTVAYFGGAITGTITKVTTGLWTPGFQAPQGMRFILVDLTATNNSAADVNVGDPEFVLLLPDGSRENQKTLYGYFINDVLGGHESKDEGYICFLAPPAAGDFQIIFFNQDNGVAGMVDLGTL